MIRRSLQFVSLGLCAATTLMLGGCAGGATNGDAQAGSAGVRAARSGLELRRWVIRGPRGQSDRLLGVLAEPGEFDVPSEARRWEQGGVRAARVDAADVDVLRQYLSDGEGGSGGLGALVQERIEWVGLLPEWVPIHRGVTRPETTAMIDSGPLRVDAGAVSLLGRSWVMPGLEGGALRVELMPQVPVRGAEGTVFIDGAPLMRQHLGTTLAPGEALIVFPAASWASLSMASGERAEFRPEQAELNQVGPPVPTTPSLGELMLVVDGPTASAPGETVLEQVLVFVAHLPQASAVQLVDPDATPLTAPRDEIAPREEPAAETEAEPTESEAEPAATESSEDAKSLPTEADPPAKPTPATPTGSDRP